MNSTPQPPASHAVRLHLIYAKARNGVIGRDNTLPWHLPEDLAHFKQKTLGCPVLMGRKTWDSLPPQFRPLPGRQNIVISRQPGLAAPGAQTAGSLHDALALCPNGSDVWVIGGAQVYAQALALAQTVEVTEIDADFDGDATAPSLDSHWTGTPSEWFQSRTGLAYRFVRYVRSVQSAALPRNPSETA